MAAHERAHEIAAGGRARDDGLAAQEPAQVVGERLGGRVAPVALGLEGLRDHEREVDRDAGDDVAQGRRGPPQRLGPLGQRLPRRVARQPAGDEFEGEHAERVDVGARVDVRRDALDLLEAHVGERADEVAVAGVQGADRRRVAERARDPEVDDLRRAGLGHEDVAGLEVAMDDAAGVRVGDALRDGRQQRDLVPQPRAVRAAPHVDRRPLHQLHRDPRHLAAEGRAGVHGVDLGHAGCFSRASTSASWAMRWRRRSSDPGERNTFRATVRRGLACSASYTAPAPPKPSRRPIVNPGMASFPRSTGRSGPPRSGVGVCRGPEGSDACVSRARSAATSAWRSQSPPQASSRASRRDAPRRPRTRSYTTRARGVQTESGEGSSLWITGEPIGPRPEAPRCLVRHRMGRSAGRRLRDAGGGGGWPPNRGEPPPARGVREDVRLEDLPWARTTTISPWCDAPRPARPRRSEG